MAASFMNSKVEGSSFIRNVDNWLPDYKTLLRKRGSSLC